MGTQKKKKSREKARVPSRAEKYPSNPGREKTAGAKTKKL